jgi:hypothetical protein
MATGGPICLTSADVFPSCVTLTAACLLSLANGFGTGSFGTKLPVRTLRYLPEAYDAVRHIFRLARNYVRSTRKPLGGRAVESIRVAQFIYLILHNSNVRQVIDTITSKVVLILGRFTPRRKAVLDAFREELKLQNYVPVVFDFTKPSSRATYPEVNIAERRRHDQANTFLISPFR